MGPVTRIERSSALFSPYVGKRKRITACAACGRFTEADVSALQKTVTIYLGFYVGFPPTENFHGQSQMSFGWDRQFSPQCKNPHCPKSQYGRSRKKRFRQLLISVLLRGCCRSTPLCRFPCFGGFTANVAPSKWFSREEQAFSL